MDMDRQSNKERNGSIPKLKLTELEHAMLAATQEVDGYKRERMLLKETVSRLEEDRDVLRAREARDHVRIRDLLDKIERNEKEFSDKLAELTMKNWDLESENRMLKFVQGNKELKPSDEMPKRTVECDVVMVDSDGDSGGGGGGIPMSQLRKKKRPLDDAKKDSGSSSNNSVEEFGCTSMPTIDAHEMSAAKGVQSDSKRNVKNQNGQRAYTGRTASFEQKTNAVNRAKLLQRKLMSCKPSCIRPMVKSHVSGSFWLSLHRGFCKENLPACEQKMILEDEKGLEYEVKYLGNHTALSGGWRGFAMAHSLEIDDVLLFELREPTRFKVYIVKAVLQLTEDFDDEIAGERADGTNKMASSNGKENEDVDLSDFSRRLQKVDMQIKQE